MLKETREAIAARLNAAIPDIQASPVMLSEPTAPAAHVFPTPIDFDSAFQRGSDEWTFTLQVFVTTASGDVGAQELLDEYIEPEGPRSIKAILEEPDLDGRVTLGGVIDDLHVKRCEGYRIYQREGRSPALGSEWIIAVTASGREEE